MREVEQQVGREDKIARYRVNARETPLHSVLTKAVRAAVATAAAHQVQNFRIDTTSLIGPGLPSHQILVDEIAFLTIFRNLIDNTIKYRNKENPSTEVLLWVEVEDAHHIALHYADNGVDIPRWERSRIFAHGFRGRVARRVNVQGLGIGLHECEVLMHAMHGGISCPDSINPDYPAEFILRFRTA